MTSSMLTGERRWASSRRGGMTVIGKVAVPKPINLPSQKLENHGLNPNVEIVPKGTISWGSRPSSSASNAWGSSTLSPTTDGSTGSPTHPSGRPSSGGSGTRPSTAGSDTGNNTWGPNSRPSSASGVLTSNQTSLALLRPRSADTRPTSSLSRFAESSGNSGAWSGSGTNEKLEVAQSKKDGFNLSSGDFPTLGSEKDSAAKNTEPQEHGSRSRPGSSSSGVSMARDRSGPSPTGEVAPNPRSENVNTWRNDNAPQDGFRPNMEKWQGEPQPYLNPNMPPHPPFGTWHGPPTQGAVWYRGPPSGPPFRPALGPTGFPMEYPYYHAPIPGNTQPIPPLLGAGLRGPHPNSGDMRGPHIPDSYIRPGMQVRPGFYPPGPVPYDSYYGPPMGYCNTNEPRDIPFRGMTPPCPPDYNRYTGQAVPDPSKSQVGPAGYGPTTGKAFGQEQVDPCYPQDPRGQYKVLLKHHNGSDGKEEEQKWKQDVPNNASSFEKEDQHRTTSRETNRRQDYKNDEQVKIEGLNAKSRDSHGKRESREEQKGTSFPNARVMHPTNEGVSGALRQGRTVTTGDTSLETAAISENSLPRKTIQGPQGRVDQRGKGRFNTHEADVWQKKAVIVESSEITENTGSHLEGDNSESMSDPSDIQAQRAKMREIAKQRAKQLQIEEEERTREQKAKAQAKLEELNRRTQAVESSTHKLENPSPVEKSINPSKDESNTNSCTAKEITDPPLEAPKIISQAPIFTPKQPEPLKQDVEKAEVIPKQKRPSYKQKLNASIEKSTTSADLAPKSHDDVAVSVVTHPEAVKEETTLPVNSNAVPEPSVNQKRKNNKNGKNNKNKMEDTTSVGAAIPPVGPKDANIVKSVGESVKPTFSEWDSDLKPVEPVASSSFEQKPSLPIEESSHVRANNNPWKSQNPRRVPSRAQHVSNRPVEKFHGGGDGVVWAPVRSQKKTEVVDETKDKTVSTEAVSITTQGDVPVKNKRAEMERYVPKPVAKELAQHVSHSNPANQISSDESGSQNTANITQPAGIEKLGYPTGPRTGSSSKHSKGHGAWRQRGTSELARAQVPHDESSKKIEEIQEPIKIMPDVLPPVEEQAKDYDGWNSNPEDWNPPPTNYDSAASIPNPVVKDQGFKGKGKRIPYKGQQHKSTGNNSNYENDQKNPNFTNYDKVYSQSPAVDFNETEKTVPVSQWQPKSQGYNRKGNNRPSGSQNVTPEVGKFIKKESNPKPHNLSGTEEISKNVTEAPNLEHQGGPEINEGTGSRPEHQQVPFRKNTNQTNRFVRGQYGQPANRERQQRYNSEYDYQPNVPYNNKSNNFEGPSDRPSSFRERAQSHSKRGGGNNSYGRQSGGAGNSETAYD